MSHSVHPYLSLRLGIIRDWKSRWFGTDKNYRTALKADLIMREYLDKELRANYLADIDIERNQKSLTRHHPNIASRHDHRPPRRGWSSCATRS